MSNRKIQATKNYRLFTRSPENRPLDMQKHRKLLESMKTYGFLACFPLVVHRVNGSLVVKDGQHRLAIAESLGLTVHWIEEKADFDVAVINCTSKIWQIRDYAQKFAANGNDAYRAGLDFAEQHSIPIGTAFALLSGSVAFGNIKDDYVAGTFKIKDLAWANAVAGIYGPMIHMSDALKNNRFIEACMAVCRVAEFDAKRLLHGAERCREKLVNYATRDAYLDMMEFIYNFNRSKLFALKIEAIKAMRERSAVSPKAIAKRAAAAS